MRFDRESFFMHCLQKEGVTQGIGDDCCILLNASPKMYKTHSAHIQSLTHHCPALFAKSNKSLAIGMDSFCEGVHFLQKWFSPYEIAQKAFMVNHSDMVAMNAKPLYAMLSIALPKHWERREIKDFARGVGDFCRLWGIKIIGGDTISAEKMQIHITYFGLKHKHTLYRDKIAHGSLICCTCDMYPKYALTQSLKNLNMLLKNPKAKKPKGIFLSPKLRADFISHCAHFLRGGMDISDGILSEITRLCALNHAGFKSFIPLFSAQSRLFLQSAEVYEMLFAIAPKDLLRAKQIAKKYRIRIRPLGMLSKKRYKLPPYRKWH
ncbi:thiamine-phosphate kinase [Helicobacter jaachi]|uniref:Thiamine-phosphate kinase n=1 Tax=Helicobacter jaachi TaxID=1677920 RepID=A0A4U8T9U2_9HELI|nr:thiamine-phosphate kinase [Helicobacter jaachi]TLD96581.1 thiamine-phosphate kinase [Helicobacter jaachi]